MELWLMMIRMLILTVFLLMFCSITLTPLVLSHIITEAEYFIDIDPGIGKGTPLNSSDGAFDSNYESISTELDLSSICIGVHNIYIRMKNELGVWGKTAKYIFEITGDIDIIESEYRIEPIETNSFVNKNNVDNTLIKIPVTDCAIEATIDTSSLDAGLYKIFVRFKDSESKWGPFRQRKFEVTEAATIKSAEFSVDSITQEAYPMSPSDNNFDEGIEVLYGNIETYNLNEGDHVLYIKIIDSYQRMSIHEKIFSILKKGLIIGELNTTITGNTVPVIGASVNLNETGENVLSNSDGIFVFSDLESGLYTITVKQNGFKDLSMKDIQVKMNETTNLPYIELNTTLMEEYNGLNVNYGLLLNKYSQLSEKYSETENFNNLFDINNDKKVNLLEAINVLRIISGSYRDD